MHISTQMKSVASSLRMKNCWLFEPNCSQKIKQAAELLNTGQNSTDADCDQKECTRVGFFKQIFKINVSLSKTLIILETHNHVVSHKVTTTVP